MKLINLEKAINYGKEKDYIKTAGQEEAVREVFALATVEAVPIDVFDKIRAEIEQGYCEVNNDYDHGRNYGLYMATQIIDKYKGETENT